MGGCGGTIGARAATSPQTSQRRGGCASSSGAAAAAKMTPHPSRRRHRGRRAIKPATGAADEPRRALRGPGGPASGVAADRGDDLAGRRDRRAAPRAQRWSVRQAGSLTRSGRETSPRPPGTGKGRLLSSRCPADVKTFITRVYASPNAPGTAAITRSCAPCLTAMS